MNELSREYTEELEQYREDSQENHDPRHVTLSPPQNLYCGILEEQCIAENYRKHKNTLLRHLREKSMALSGRIVYHPYRSENDDEKADMDWWRKLIQKRKGIAELRYAPHFHFVGYGYFAKSDFFYGNTRWVYKTVRTLSSRQSIEDMFRYLLSHKLVLSPLRTCQKVGMMSGR